ALQESGLRLDSRETATKRKVVVPGKPNESLMIHRVTVQNEERMPPEEAGARLKPAQIDVLKKWIAQGAEYAPHWAFIKPKPAALPAVKDAKWVRNPIDAFILARLE